ncbi:MOSC domain-containing protein [Thioclava indica]|uniref:MOSC domain-containing protein n=1 Tax=Thioclava indica TaxID=1353528 RepID=A0A074JQY9_9RHOB|nr:MOSC domain-containing protein [Thioclava indica]KEO58889.1 hypothetical protein DT23_15875 [Thioclava indica]
MTGHLSHIYRHPIKSVGLEEIASASLSQGRALPLDRVWAIAHTRSKVAGDAEGRAQSWGKKANFLTGCASGSLMAITARCLEDGRLLLQHPDLWHVEIDPTRAADHAKLFEWLRALWPADAPQPNALLRAPEDQPLSDQSTPLLSLIGQASLNDLSAKLGQPLSRARFRANLWVEDWEPFAEFDLIGCQIRVGDARLEVRKRVGRCRATDANPETGLRDIDMLPALSQHYNHTDLGVFCAVIEGGEIARGARVEVI